MRAFSFSFWQQPQNTVTSPIAPSLTTTDVVSYSAGTPQIKRTIEVNPVLLEIFPKAPIQFEESYFKQKAEHSCTFTKVFNTKISNLDVFAKKAGLDVRWRISFDALFFLLALLLGFILPEMMIAFMMVWVIFVVGFELYNTYIKRKYRCVESFVEDQLLEQRKKIDNWQDDLVEFKGKINIAEADLNKIYKKQQK